MRSLVVLYRVMWYNVHEIKFSTGTHWQCFLIVYDPYRIATNI